MSGWLAVFRREMENQFASPMAYVLACGYLLWSAVAWTGLVEEYFRSARHAVAEGFAPAGSFSSAVLEPSFTGLAFGLLLFVPFLSMRLLAEERRSGFDEILFTLPLSETQVVLGKFAAGAVLVAGLVATALLPAGFLPGEGAIDPGHVVSAAIGLFLFGLAALALGIWTSALAGSQVAAAVIALTSLLLLFLADRPLDGRLAAISLRVAFDRFGRGVIGLRDATHLVAFIAFFVFLAVQTLAGRRRSA